MQLLDRDRYFAGKSWKPGHETMEGETGTHHNELSKSGKREGGPAPLTAPGSQRMVFT